MTTGCCYFFGALRAADRVIRERDASGSGLGFELLTDTRGTNSINPVCTKPIGSKKKKERYKILPFFRFSFFL